MPAAAPRFPEEGLRFLRALARNNDREWFRARKDVYERALRRPMAAVVEAFDRDFRTYAPELVAVPRVSIFRIYRDTRFSEDKTPLKTHIAAVFPYHGLPKGSAPGLYLEVNPRTVFVAGGLYRPDPTDLRAVREHLAANYTRFRSIIDSPGFRRTCGALHGDQLQRPPRGYAPDHPAAAYLRYRQFVVVREFPASLATTARFFPTVRAVFRTAAPLVGFLGEPLVPRASR
jgi:uncharacterized protein (TIGR02453 family)